jgi:hypothetical protein
MKRFIVIFGLVAIGAAAQEKPSPGAYVFSSPVMGKAIKGAPYSAEEITESLQVLADGTRISHQSKTTVYRDGEGRVRRESPDRITIFDPVAGFSYTLDPTAMTAEQGTMGTLIMNNNKRLFVVRSSATQSADPAVRAKAEADAKLAKIKAEIAAQLDDAVAKLKVEGGTTVSESLGRQVIEGVTADGTRATETIDSGAIGNDRPIHIVNEVWISADLQTTVMTKHTDPRSGEETFRLTNVQRGEPPAYLFVLPPGYQLVTSESKKDQ